MSIFLKWINNIFSQQHKHKHHHKPKALFLNNTVNNVCLFYLPYFPYLHCDGGTLMILNTTLQFSSTPLYSKLSFSDIQGGKEMTRDIEDGTKTDQNKRWETRAQTSPTHLCESWSNKIKVTFSLEQFGLNQRIKLFITSSLTKFRLTRITQWQFSDKVSQETIIWLDGCWAWWLSIPRS